MEKDKTQQMIKIKQKKCGQATNQVFNDLTITFCSRLKRHQLYGSDISI